MVVEFRNQLLNTIISITINWSSSRAAQNMPATDHNPSSCSSPNAHLWTSTPDLAPDVANLDKGHLVFQGLNPWRSRNKIKILIDILGHPHAWSLHIKKPKYSLYKMSKICKLSWVPRKDSLPIIFLLIFPIVLKAMIHTYGII